MAEKGILERATFAADGIILKEGSDGEKAYVVQSGAVEIIKDIDGKTVVLGIVKQGGIFGEMALIDDKAAHGHGARQRRDHPYRRLADDVFLQIGQNGPVYPWIAQHFRGKHPQNVEVNGAPL